MKPKHFFAGFILFILFLLFAPLLVPMDAYLRQLEKMAADKLGAPVNIQTMHIAVLPSPRINIKKITIGKHAEIQVDQFAAVLDVTTLFKPIRVVSRLDIDHPVIKQSAIDLLSPILAQEGNDGASPVTIRHIEVHDAQIEWSGTALPRFDADIAMHDDAKLQQASITSTDHKLRIEAVPNDDGYAAVIKAQQWTLPVGLPVRLDTLQTEMMYATQALNMPSLDATLYGGKLNASANLKWKKNWQLAGKFKTEAIELKDVSRLMTKSVSVSGLISGNGTFSSTAKEPSKLADKLVLDYSFNVAKGVLHGMDLAKAASLFIKQGGKGGQTEFDQLSGRLHTTGKQVELRDMKVMSGLLAASGRVRISPSQSLDGLVDVELKKGLAKVTVPLSVSGTVDAPEIMPTNAAIAGAAAGTAVLGPMGTSIGMEAGSALDKLFGHK